MISESDKILRRAAHYCFDYRNEVYIWGGFMEYLPKVILSLFITILDVQQSFSMNFKISRIQNGQIQFQKMEMIYILRMNY